MSFFDDVFVDAADTIADTFGDVVTYRPLSGGEISGVKAIKNTAAEIIGGDMETVYLGTTFEFLRSEVTVQVSRGDVIATDSGDFVVEAVLAEDAFFISVVVK